jgi:hypothetical protein
MTEFPPGFFDISQGGQILSLDRACQEFRGPRPLYAPQPEPLSAAPTVTDIRLNAIVGPDGHLSQIQAVDHLYPDLNERAIQNVSSWRFTAPYCDGKTMAIQTNVTVEFKGR